MKKIYICLVMMLLTQFFVFAQETKKVYFELTPKAGISFGKWGEYLYDTEGEKLLSLLEWKSKPVFAAGVEGKLSFNIFEFDLGTAFGFSPNKNGTMFDSDWNEDGVKIIYSENDLYTDFLCDVNLDFFVNFQKGIFTFSPSAGINYSTFFFTARDGYGWYGDAKHSASGKDVEYKSSAARYYPHISGYSIYRIHTLMYFMGLRTTIKPFPALDVCAEFSVSPFTFTFTKDVHFRKSGIPSKYALSGHNIFFGRFKAGLSLNFSLSKKIGITLGGTCLFGPTKKGTYFFFVNGSTTEEDYYLNQDGISACDILDCKIMAGVNIKF